MNLSGKVALVTGAVGAIGSALLKELESKGVVCIAVDKGLEFGCDFRDQAAVIDLLVKIKALYPKIDFLFNIAGIGIYKNINELGFESWLDSFSVNVHAPFLFIQQLLPNLKSSKKPMILNMGSGMGVIGAADRSAYCSSKFALRGLSLSLSKELQSENIDVVLMTLGSVMTPFGTGGIDKRKELARHGKKYLTVNEVVEKIIEITKSDKRDFEYTMYPEGYI